MNTSKQTATIKETKTLLPVIFKYFRPIQIDLKHVIFAKPAIAIINFSKIISNFWNSTNELQILMFSGNNSHIFGTMYHID